MMLSKKREAVDKHESVGRSDKVSPAKDEVLEVSIRPILDYDDYIMWN